METIYAETPRPYLESPPPYFLKFLSILTPPGVDVIEGLSPAISIKKKRVLSHNLLSKISTVTKIYDSLRLLFEYILETICPNHSVILHQIDIVVDRVINHDCHQQRLIEAFDRAPNLSDGILKVTMLSKNKNIKDTIVFF